MHNTNETTLLPALLQYLLLLPHFFSCFIYFFTEFVFTLCLLLLSMFTYVVFFYWVHLHFVCCFIYKTQVWSYFASCLFTSLSLFTFCQLFVYFTEKTEYVYLSVKTEFVNNLSAVGLLSLFYLLRKMSFFTFLSLFTFCQLFVYKNWFVYFSEFVYKTEYYG